MSKEWDLMRDIAEAANNKTQDEIAEIIVNNCFDGMKKAVEIAVCVFELTEKNIKLHTEAALKLAKLEQPEPFREAVRHSLLNEILLDLDLYS